MPSFEHERFFPVISKPCAQSWDAMPGDNRKRFCAECGHHVYNLSALTEHERASLFSDPDHIPCVRYAVKQTGAIVSADAEPVVPSVGSTLARWLAPILGAAVAAGASGCMGATLPKQPLAVKAPMADSSTAQRSTDAGDEGSTVEMVTLGIVCEPPAARLEHRKK